MTINSYYEKQYFQNRVQKSFFLKGRWSSFFNIIVNHPFWNRIVKKYSSSGNLLDIGCAEGFLLRWAEKNHYFTFGIDISEYAIRNLSGKILNHSNLFISNIENLPFMDNTFEVITCFDVLEHLRNPTIGLFEINRCLKKNGILVLSMPNSNSYGKIWKKSNWFAYRDPTHVSLLTVQNWKNLIHKAGFDVINEFYDMLWDTPYFQNIPNFLQYILRSVILIFQKLTPIKIPNKFGEDVFFIVKKL
jgi:2-polyprenyl-3-methyl-5-hydroxy-6-metoxy-1,4-benzoquinol methylase